MSIADRVCRAVREEIRECGLLREHRPYMPIPCDLDAEGEILSAILDGHVTQAELAPLSAKHFYADINSAVWMAVENATPGDLMQVIAFLKTRGYRGDLEREIENLELHQPWVSVPRLKQHGSRLMELWARRQLVALVRSLEVDLCHGNATADEARRRFEARAREVLG
jgi:replicative DNA helicase